MTAAPRTAIPAAGPAASRQTDAAIAALEQQLGALFSTVRTLVRDRAAQLHPDLTAAGFTLLSMLVMNGPQHARALADALGLDKSSVSRSVKQLIDLGLVERRPDPSDGRAFFLAATPDAARRVDELRDEQRRRLYDYLTSWNVGDIEQLTDLLRRLNGAR